MEITLISSIGFRETLLRVSDMFMYGLASAVFAGKVWYRKRGAWCSERCS